MIAPYRVSFALRSHLLLVSGLLLACLLSGLALHLREKSISPPHGRAANASDASSLTAGHRRESQSLQGEKAIHALKERGLYDRMRASMEASRYELNWRKQANLPELGSAYEADNPAHGLRAYFTPSEVRIAPGESDQARCAVTPPQQWSFGMKLRGYGYGEQIKSLGAGIATAKGNRLEIEKSAIGNSQSAITEWYVNRKEGIEQGFTLASPPSLRFGVEPLHVALEVTGDLQARVEEEGQAVALSVRGGKQVLSYDHLAAVDALGRSLPSHLAVADNEVSLVVDDAAAVYPIQIDPLLTQVKKLTASDGAEEDEFGYSVAISGDTVVVGARGKNDNTGAAYIYGRNQGGAENWGVVKKLTDSDVTSDDEFGHSVAISGDTVVVGAPIRNDTVGAAYIYSRNQGGAENWGVVKILTASDGDVSNHFGNSVAISDDTIVVGAPVRNSQTGAAYIYGRNFDPLHPGTPLADNWGEVKKLAASDSAPDAEFGNSVAISDDTIVVGAHLKNSGRGAAYVYGRNFDPLHPGTPLADNWGEVKKLTASDGTFNDFFGSVAISGDTVVVGASGKNSQQGAAYIYGRNFDPLHPGTPLADNWGQVKKLTDSDGATNDGFGVGVAISGDTVVVGAFLKNSDRGAAYIFSRNQGGAENWGQAEKLTASDAAPGDEFGSSVAISDGTVVVGARGKNIFTGAAYVYEDQCNQWVQRREPTASDGASNDRFGWSVAISADTFVVGEPLQNSNTGAAYVFSRNQGGVDNWGQVQKLTASDGAANDRFGDSVAISGDTIVVGASAKNSQKGAAYIHYRNFDPLHPSTPLADNWGEVKKLTASDGVNNDFFGNSVAISDDTVVIGAFFKNSQKGAAYIYYRNFDPLHPSTPLADNWGEVKKLTASDSAANDEFGFWVAISDDTVVIGAPFKNSSTGAAYIYSRNFDPLHPSTPLADNWGEVKKLTASDGAANNEFGFSAAISDDTVVVGAYLNNSAKGAAYIYSRNFDPLHPSTPLADNWGEVKKLTASDGAANDEFGWEVTVSDGTVVVGAPKNSIYPGAAYVFEINCPPVITPASISRQQGAASSNSTIATVVDDLTAAGSITVTLDSAPTGISVTNIVNSSGTITADVSADCTAATGNNLVSLKATDADGAFSTASFTINVTAAATPSANAGSNQAQCQALSGPTTFTLHGTATGGTPHWTYLNGSISSGNVNIVSPNSATTDVQVTGLGNVTLRLTVTGACSSTTSDVTLTVNPLPNCLITGPTSVTAFSVGNSYSAPTGANLSYSWMISGNGTFAGGGTTAMGSPVSVTAGGLGTYTLTLTVTNTMTSCTSTCSTTVKVNLPPVNLNGDYDGDGKTDLAIWRPSNATFYIYSPATGGTITKQWGVPTDIPVPGDYDGDGKTDIALYRPSTGAWLVLFSSNGQTPNWTWGIPGDVPVPGDYDGDGKTDLAVWRPSTGTWFIFKSSGGTMTIQWGAPGDVPAQGDYDGDGRTDLGIWRPSTATFWIYNTMTTSVTSKLWGASTDIPVPGDYDGDHKTDIALWRPSTGAWLIFQSSNGQSPNWTWGLSTDLPAPGDFDGDSKTDLGVWRPSTGTWFIFKSSGGTMTIQWGTTGDLPIS